jgi:hypothetical protein
LHINKIELKEYYNKKVVKYVLDHINDIEYRLIEDPNSFNPKQMIEKHLKNVMNTKDGYINILYENINDNRFHSKNKASYQGMMREFRSLLCHLDFYDIDMKNAQPSLLLQYCEKNKIKCKHLKKYVDMRDEIIKTLMGTYTESREEIKNIFIALINGSKLKTKYEHDDFINDFYNEIKSIHLKISEIEKELKIEIQKKKKDNVNGKLCNFIMGRLENQMLMECKLFFETNNYEVNTLIFDGLLVRNTKEINGQIIKKLNAFVKKQTGYIVEFIIKQWDTTNKINVDELDKIEIHDNIFVNDDQECVNYILNELDDKLIMCNGKFYYLDEDVENNKSLYKMDTSKNNKNTIIYISKYISSLNVTKENNDKLQINYNKDTRNLFALRQNVFDHLKNNSKFLENCIKQNKYKICFLNGYYDMYEKKFKNYDNTFKSFMYISRNYEEPTEEDIKQVYDLLLNTIFDEKQRKSILNWFARALAGEMHDKTLSFGIGQRNCGKGVISITFECSFGNYVSSFAADELLSSVNNTDATKKKGWLLDLQYYRLLLCNEIKTREKEKECVLDGNLLKSISSGGDTLSGRRNFGDPENFKLNGRVMLFMNEMMKVDPYDATQTINIIQFNNVFKTEITEKDKVINLGGEFKILKSNPNIKNIVQENYFKNAFCKIIFDNYGEPLYNITDEQKMDQNDLIDDDNSPDKELFKYFEFTNDNDDIVLSNKINEIKDGLNFKKATLNFFLKSNGAIQYKNDEKRGWRRLKIIKTVY